MLQMLLARVSGVRPFDLSLFYTPNIHPHRFARASNICNIYLAWSMTKIETNWCIAVNVPRAGC